MTKKLILASLLVGLVLAGTVSAETTVVSETWPDFPHDRELRVFVERDNVFLECTNEYADSSSEIIKPDEFLSVLEKLLEWMQLNKQVKAKVGKQIPMMGAKVTFHGEESGGSFAMVGVNSSSCFIHSLHVQSMIDGINNNLEKARTEEAKNKADLFK